MPSVRTSATEAEDINNLDEYILVPVHERVTRTVTSLCRPTRYYTLKAVGRLSRVQQRFTQCQVCRAVPIARLWWLLELPSRDETAESNELLACERCASTCLATALFQDYKRTLDRAISNMWVRQRTVQSRLDTPSSELLAVLLGTEPDALLGQSLQALEGVPSEVRRYWDPEGTPAHWDYSSPSRRLLPNGQYRIIINTNDHFTSRVYSYQVRTVQHSVSSPTLNGVRIIRAGQETRQGMLWTGFASLTERGGMRIWSRVREQQHIPHQYVSALMLLHLAERMTSVPYRYGFTHSGRSSVACNAAMCNRCNAESTSIGMCDDCSRVLNTAGQQHLLDNLNIHTDEEAGTRAVTYPTFMERSLTATFPPQSRNLSATYQHNVLSNAAAHPTASPRSIEHSTDVASSPALDELGTGEVR